MGRLKPGDRVALFHDPFIKKFPDGFGVLQQKVLDRSNHEVWLVIREGEVKPITRTFYKE